MRNKLIRTGVLAASLIGLLGTPTPALATTQATATFTGDATTSPIGYPCTPVTTTTPCTPTPGTGPFFGYQFASTVCVGMKTDVNKPNKHGTDAYGPDCSIRASGTATGYCGLSQSHTGTATITYSGGLGRIKSLTLDFSFTSMGDILIITGTGQKTPGGSFPGVLAGIGQITPVPSAPGGPSCTTGTQTQILLSGSVSYTEVT